MASTPPPVNPSPQDAAWFRWATKQLIETGRTARQANTRAGAANQQATIIAGQVGSQQPDITATVIKASQPVNVVALATAGGFNADGSAYGELNVSWPEVTTTTAGDALDNVEYEVWTQPHDDSAPASRMTATQTSEVTFRATPEQQLRIFVRARSTRGVWSEFSEPVIVSPTAPSALLGQPSEPTFLPGSVTVSVHWDGLIDGEEPGPNFWNVYAEQATSETGPWTRVGSILQGAGDIVVRQEAGQLRWYRLVAVDTLGRTGEPSGAASVTAEAIHYVDIDQDITDAIDQASQDASDAVSQVGNAIATSIDEYVVTDSATTPPGPGADWDPDTPDWEPGQYVWRRTRATRINGDVTYSSPVVITGADGTPGEDAVLLRIVSSQGNAFKNNEVSTILTASVFKGSREITNLTDLHDEFGPTAYLEWWYRPKGAPSFAVISSADTRLSQGGFALTISPADVDEQTVFQCSLHS